MNLRICLPVMLVAALAVGQNIPVVPYDTLMSDMVTVDGYIDREEFEYPGHFADKATGINVWWGHDDSTMYVGLETRGKGWLAVGFGPRGGSSATAFIGFYTEESAEVVAARVPYGSQGIGTAGAPGYDGILPAGADSAGWDAEIDRDDETGVTTMEVAFPLALPGADGGAPTVLEPGKTFDLILAQNAKTADLAAKQTHKSVLEFKLGGAK